MKFIKIIENELKNKNITVKKMLSDLKLAPNSMIHWRKGNSPSIDKISQIADYFDISVDYLIGKTNSKSSLNSDKNSIQLDEIEKNTIINFRELDERGKKIIADLSDYLLFLNTS